MSGNNSICTVCKRQKNQLHIRKSKVWPNLTLHMCGACFDGKYEPRFAIIMAVRTYGVTPEIRDYIVNRRYVGEEISLKETT